MTTADAFAAIQRHKRSLTPAFDSWFASVQIETPKRAGRPSMRVVSATGPTPIIAVEELVIRLEHERPLANFAGGR